MSSPLAENEPSITSALERIIIASQRVIGDRIDLVFLEARGLLAVALRGFLALGLAIGLLLLAWVAASSMLVFVLLGAMSKGGALAVVAAINLVLGLMLLRTALAKIDVAVSSAEARRRADPQES